MERSNILRPSCDVFLEGSPVSCLNKHVTYTQLWLLSVINTDDKIKIEIKPIQHSDMRDW